MRKQDESKKSVMLDFIDEYYNEYNEIPAFFCAFNVEIYRRKGRKDEIYYNAVGIIDLPTIKEDDCIALHGRCKGKKIAV